MTFWHALVVSTLVGTTVVPLVVAGGVPAEEEVPDGVVEADVLVLWVVVLVAGVVDTTQTMMATVT
jgi:hypothetical protein